jgi:hypothetical protein
MAIRTLGTTSTTVLRCSTNWSAVIPVADIAAIGDSITDDRQISALSGGAGPTAVIGTASTHSNNTLDTIVRVSGAAIGQIMVGDLVLGPGIPLGTFVTAKASQVSISLSSSATTAAGGVNVIFVRGGPGTDTYLDAGSQILFVPGRGTLKVLPGDIVAVDSSGWPILVSGAAVAAAGSNWTLT